MRLHVSRRTVLAGLAAGATTPAMAQAPGGPVVVYTSNSAQAVEAVTDVATKLMPNVKLSTVTGGSGQLLRRIEAEAGKAQGDVFWSSSANTLGAFKPLFEPYKPVGSDKILYSLRDPADLWTACNIHVAVMMVNKNQLGDLPMPKSWTDLRDRRWKGKVIIADPANSSTAYTILWGLEQLFGRGDAFNEFAANVKVTSSAPTVLRAVAQGEYAIGLTFEANAYTYVAGGQAEISLVYPGDGTFTTAEYLALIKGAPAGDGATKVADLLVSREVQVALLESAFRRPSRTDIEVGRHVKLPELATIKVFPTNEDDAAAQRKDFLTRWQALATAN